MTEYAANLLIREIERRGQWPPRFDHDAVSIVARRAAYREGDETALRRAHNWQNGREYYIDPIPDRMALARADLLFGEDPRIQAAQKTDRNRGNLDRVVEGNDLPSELHHAEQIRASEGEVFWRVMADPDTVDFPLVTFHSREVSIPLYVGSALVAVAFVSEFDHPEDLGRNERERRIYRLLEIQSVGRVENRLYLGSRTQLGPGQALDVFEETAELESVWDTPIDALMAGRIVNRRGRDRRLGRGMWDVPVESLFLALNEAMTIGVENARLVAKKRAVVPASALDDQPSGVDDVVDLGDGSFAPTSPRRWTWDDSADLLVAGGGLDTGMGKESSPDVFKVLEYTFDAAALIAWQDALVRTIASRCGLTVQFLGVENQTAEGTAATGTALRVRLLPATSSARGSARAWDDALPRMLKVAQLLDAASLGDGGFGRTWTDPATAPTIERRDPLPRDESEEVTREVTATGGAVRSIREGVRRLNPDWQDEDVDAEVERIREDEKARVPTGIALPGPTDEPPGDEDPPEPAPE